MRPIQSIFITALSGVLISCAEGEPPAPSQPRLVQIASVEGVGPQRNYEFVGRIEAIQSVDLSFQVGGQLAELPATDGLAITQGELVARLDLEDFRRAEREARVQLEQAQTDLERQQTLFDRGIASEAARDNAQTQYNLRLVARDNARQALQNATLEAPFSGLISRVLVENFTVVSAGQPVARLQDLSELRVSIPIGEDLVATFNADELVRIEASFAFLPGQRFELEPRELVAEADTASQTYRGILALPQDIPANILPGMSTTVFAEFSSLAELPDTVHVPVNALGFDSAGEPVVFVYDSGSGIVSRRPVETADIVDDEIAVTSGLAAGEQIVTAGVSRLQDGMAVRPLSEVYGDQ
ncbi:efflux RND transporter periplasmic adaptor subunit [Hyphobacterium sp.]|uniref:efflux RND transporter periplasmic adaptor subunit n=1 Tax=Hyphobacterium sp. TaxID=2004662 RepID=UPI003BAC9865